MNQLLVELKGLVLKASLVPSSLITPKLLSQKFFFLINYSKGVSPSIEVVEYYANGCPTSFHKGARGEKIGIGMGSMFRTDGSSSKKNDEDVKVVGKVSSTQIPISLVTISIISTSTTTITRLVAKGIVIGGYVAVGSSSKPLPTIE
ncbi:unnamed protein product [Lactuca saligna]|uniref:Uncharacterized protein n=1 Tax=Lactuca saligna TaxID=75948 RepID=A0AA36E036_LACSI|nr:unnamed protein product [Lactuca saligna]